MTNSVALGYRMWKKGLKLWAVSAQKMAFCSSTSPICASATAQSIVSVGALLRMC